MCTLASIFLFIAFHSIIRNPVATGIDYAIVIVIVVALYVENQVTHETVWTYRKGLASLMLLGLRW